MTPLYKSLKGLINPIIDVVHKCLSIQFINLFLRKELQRLVEIGMINRNVKSIGYIKIGKLVYARKFLHGIEQVLIKQMFYFDTESYTNDHILQSNIEKTLTSKIRKKFNLSQCTTPCLI